MTFELLFDWLGDSFKNEEAASKLEQHMLVVLLLDPNTVVPSFNRKTMEVFTNLEGGKFSFRVPKKFREKL
jgi:hypothetical protein